MSNAKKNLRKAKREAYEARQRKQATKVLFGALILLIVLTIIAFIMIGNAA